jgi:hypothetical protein
MGQSGWVCKNPAGRGWNTKMKASRKIFGDSMMAGTGGRKECSLAPRGTEERVGCIVVCRHGAFQAYGAGGMRAISTINILAHKTNLKLSGHTEVYFFRHFTTPASMCLGRVCAQLESVSTYLENLQTLTRRTDRLQETTKMKYNLNRW